MTETQTVDLASWLTAVWDEEERLAKAEQELAQLYFARPEFTLDYEWVRLTRHTNGAYGHSFARGAPSPASVLARIAADRKILELHSYRMVASLDSHFKRIPGTERPRCNTCASQDENGEWWPCETVRLLASPYKGREGWQEAWGHE